MTIARGLGYFAIVVLLAGCAGPVCDSAPALWQTSRTMLPLDQRILVRGEPTTPAPGAAAACSADPGGGAAVRLDSLIDMKTGVVHHELAVIDRYVAMGWRYWRAAALAPADNAAPAPEQPTALPIRGIDRQVGRCGAFSWDGCAHEESLVVQLSDGQMQAGLDSGLAVTLSAPDRQRTVMLPAAWVATQWQAVAQARAERAAAATVKDRRPGRR